jgi:pSer/pThr/pTyr-binding forkhead associated (FHA) protein
MTVNALLRPTAGGTTERVDPIEGLPSFGSDRSRSVEPSQPGRYVQVEGLEETQLVRLEDDVVHVGRGLTANLHLDESSVSRRHAILVPRPSGTRILDDRSSFGTFVNGRRVEQADLNDGDVILLGRVMLRYLEV